ncbi:hypothetical protein J3A83DRAFT_4240665 [Scleroderma citrinum]
MAEKLKATNNQKGVQAKWTSIETNKLLNYLHEHCSEQMDRGNFKDSTYNAMEVFLWPFLEMGRLKDVKSIKYKWGILRNHYLVICNWCRLSGVYWDNVRGANIVSNAATTVFEIFLHARKANAIMENYQTTSWKYLEKMEDIFPEGGTTGAQAFCGGATSTLPSTSDAVSHESDHPSVAFMSGSSDVLNMYQPAADQQCHYIHCHCYQFPCPFRLVILVWAYPVGLYSIKLS